MTHTRTRLVALATCAELPAADADSRSVIAPLAERGVRAVPVVWDDPVVDWSAFNLVVVRNCWDYAARRADFLAWAHQVPRLANPCDVLAWNTDKRYLRQLAGCGVHVVPTAWVEPHAGWSPPDARPHARAIVIKPAVSLCALDTGRYDLGDATQRRLATAHVRRLQHAGRTVMVQPYLDGVDADGETSVVFLDGRFSHAVRKGAMLDGPDRGVDRRFAPEGGQELRPRVPTTTQLRLAARALAAVPGGPDRLLYARVDLVPGPDGRPLVLEVELTEPQLYLAREPAAAVRLAAAIAARCGDGPSAAAVSVEEVLHGARARLDSEPRDVGAHPRDPHGRGSRCVGAPDPQGSTGRRVRPVWALLALGVLSTSLAYLLYFELLERIGPTNSSTVTYLLPVVGLLCGVIFLGERWSAGMLVGLLLVLASVLLVNEVRVGPRLMLLPRRPAV